MLARWKRDTPARLARLLAVVLAAALLVALGEPLGDGAWSVRLHHKPFVRWIWLGAGLMALGGILAASDRRYRRRTVEPGTPDPLLAVVASTDPARAGETT